MVSLLSFIVFFAELFFFLSFSSSLTVLPMDLLFTLLHGICYFLVVSVFLWEIRCSSYFSYLRGQSFFLCASLWYVLLRITRLCYYGFFFSFKVGPAFPLVFFIITWIFTLYLFVFAS